MEEMMTMMETLEKVQTACDGFVKEMKDMDETMKMSAWCMLCDMMFGEKSVENAEIALKQIKAVNEEMGAFAL